MEATRGLPQQDSQPDLSQEKRIALLAENPAYPPLEVREGMELLIWGVVTGRFARVPA